MPNNSVVTHKCQLSTNHIRSNRVAWLLASRCHDDVIWKCLSVRHPVTIWHLISTMVLNITIRLIT